MDAPAYSYSAVSYSSQESVSEDEYTSAFWNKLFCQCPIDGGKEAHPSNHNEEWGFKYPNPWDSTHFPKLNVASTTSTSMPAPLDAHLGDADPNNINPFSPALTSLAPIMDPEDHVQLEFALTPFQDLTHPSEENIKVASTMVLYTSESESNPFEDSLPPKVVAAIKNRFSTGTHSILGSHEVHNSKGSYWVVNIIKDEDDPDGISAGTATISAMICNTLTSDGDPCHEVCGSYRAINRHLAATKAHAHANANSNMNRNKKTDRFKCGFDGCAAGFRRKDSWRRHMDDVHGERMRAGSQISDRALSMPLSS